MLSARLDVFSIAVHPASEQYGNFFHTAYSVSLERTPLRD